jgi:hypothetical protein
MDEITKQPHKLVLDRVQKKWSSNHSKGVLAKFIEFIIIRPIAIEIVQTESIDDEGFKFCRGETLNRWRYNDSGLQLLPQNKAEEGEHKVDYCYYCLDKEKKKLAILWSSMFSGAFRGSKIKYPYHHGEVYEIIERNGVEDYNLISCWME